MSKAAEWARRVLDWRASGEDAETFAKRVQCRVGTLKWWAGRLRRPEYAALMRAAEGRDVVAQAGVRLVRVTVEPSSLSAAQLEIRLPNGCSTTVAAGFDAVLLRAVVSSMEGL